MRGAHWRPWLVWLLLLGWLPAALAAGPVESVTTTLEALAGALTALPDGGAAPSPARSAVLASTLLPALDQERLGGAVLGTYVDAASAGERRCFARAFGERIAERYAGVMARYQATRARHELLAGDAARATVRTTVTPRAGSPLVLEHHLAAATDGWRLTDLVVDGVSLVASYREEYAALIARDGLGDFLRGFPACRER